MNGVLCINKPEGYTSFDVIARLRGMTKTRKIGHTGTLDPMATGVLPVLFGRAAKACDMLPDQNKRYTAVMRLGVVTDTQDRTGAVLQKGTVTATLAQVEAVLEHFRGIQMQTPPMYSAVQVGGVRLYDLARRGIEVERPARQIEVSMLELLSADEAENLYTLDIACSKGTYIRTICHDIGQRLGCGAVLESLCRTEACGFMLSDCLTLDEVQSLADAGEVEARLMPTEMLFSGLPKLYLTAQQSHYFFNGVRLDTHNLDIAAESDMLCVYDENRRFRAIARTDRQEGRLRMLKLFELEAKT